MSLKQPILHLFHKKNTPRAFQGVFFTNKMIFSTDYLIVQYGIRHRNGKQKDIISYGYGHIAVIFFDYAFYGLHSVAMIALIFLGSLRHSVYNFGRFIYKIFASDVYAVIYPAYSQIYYSLFSLSPLK